MSWRLPLLPLLFLTFVHSRALAGPQPSEPEPPEPEAAEPEAPEPEPAEPEPAEPEPAEAEPTGPAQLEPTSEADEAALALFLEGDAHYRAGRYEQAVEDFREAYDLSGRPQLLYNLANTYERLFDYASAIESLRAYLESDEVHDVVSIQQRLQRLEMAVQSRPPDPDPPPPPPEEPRAGRGIDPVVVGLGSTAVVATAGSVTFGLMSRANRSAALQDCLPSGGALLCTGDAQRFVDRQARNALISDVFTGTAAGAAIAATVLWVVRPTGGARDGLSLSPTAGGAPGVSLRVTLAR